ncbi:MAG: phage protease [Lentisphaeria bacterium]|nr:phage protease [Lentisphaeria bacterium]
MIKLFKQAVKGLGNALAMGINDLVHVDSGGWVERDADGAPVAWRLFKFGKFTITRNGETIYGDFTREAADSILAHFAQKGGKIPLDSKHFLYALAEKLQVDESEVVKLLPDKRGTFGYASLEMREDGLWVVGVEYVPLARKLMAEGIFRYFSPVFRGLSDGMLRITSVAFTNQPAIDQLNSLAAMAEDDSCYPAGDIDALAASLDAMVAAITPSSKQKEPKMEKLLLLIAPLIGMDSISLSDDNALPEPVARKLTDLAGEVTELRASQTAQKSFLGSVKDSLGLSGDPDLKTAQAAILGLVEKGKTADELKTRVDALALEAESRKKDDLVRQGKQSGQLTKAFMEGEFFKGMDSTALAAFLETAPQAVPVDRVDRGTLPPADSLALTAEDKRMAADCGVSEEAFLKQKKSMAGITG